MTMIHKLDPKLDLVLERFVDVPRELVWKAWTVPEHLKRWFTPRPWSTVEAEIDLRPGGIFRTVMQSPEGENFPNLGCYLEVVENERLVWTNALEAGYRPKGRHSDATCEQFPFTAILSLENQGSGTKYTAIAIHANEADTKVHSQMGFRDGWAKALDQLVELAKSWS